MQDRTLSKYQWCPGRDQWVDKLVCGRMVEEGRCVKKKGGCKPKRACSISEEERQRRSERIKAILQGQMEG